MKIAIASDHAGVELKDLLKKRLSPSHSIGDCGTTSTESVDYPDFAEKLSYEILQGKADMGILICGSGIGMSIAANRHTGIRAALCHSEETAKLARQHNNANVLVLGARTTDQATILKCVDAFFSTAFEGGRHQKRIDKMS